MIKTYITQNKWICSCLKLNSSQHIGTKESNEINWLPTKERVEQRVSSSSFKYWKGLHHGFTLQMKSKFVLACKKWIILHQFILEIQSIIELDGRGGHGRFCIFDHAQPKTFLNNLSIFMNLYQNTKHLAISSISSGDMAEIKMVQSD